MFRAVSKGAKEFFDFDYRPNCLIADAAAAIHNGFMSAYGYKSLSDFYRVVCWSHVDRNCQEKTNGIPEETKDKIIADIHSIQIMPSTKAFEKPIELFFIKWESEESSLSKAFLEHFKKEWVEKIKI